VWMKPEPPSLMNTRSFSPLPHCRLCRAARNRCHDVEQAVLVQVHDGDTVHALLNAGEVRYDDALEELAAPRGIARRITLGIFLSGGSPGRCSAISS